jgi:transposase
MKPSITLSYRLYCGIDIAKATAQVAIMPSNERVIKPFAISNDRAGFDTLRQTLELDDIQPADILVVIEPTGSYYLPLARFLYRAGYAVIVINSFTARRHIQAMLEQDKTDRIDALHLAEIALLVHDKLSLWEEPPLIYEELRQRLDLRDALVDMRAKQLNRQHATQGRLHLDLVDQQRLEILGYIDEKIHSLEKQIKQILLSHPTWGTNARYLLSIPGFGVYIVTSLLVSTLNFTALESADQLAAYVGVVPRQRASGNQSYASIRYSSVPRLRHALYMCTLSAVRFNPVIRAYYHQLVARGKRRQKVRIACIRKMLHIAWGCVHNQMMFDPDYASNRLKTA